MSEDKCKPNENSQVLPVYAQMYYEHQYDRMAKLEEQGMLITNVVVSLNILAFTFGFNNAVAPSVIAGIGLPVVMVIANLFAILYINRTSSWIRTHRMRAKRILRDLSPTLYALDQTTVAPHPKGVFGVGRRTIQIILHLLLIITSILVPLVLYLP